MYSQNTTQQTHTVQTLKWKFSNTSGNITNSMFQLKIYPSVVTSESSEKLCSLKLATVT